MANEGLRAGRFLSQKLTPADPAALLAVVMTVRAMPAGSSDTETDER
jgi:hypothetical protein